jgi:hypothetical protein
MLFVASAAADDVHLADGQVLSGRVTEEGSRYTIVDRDRKYAVAKAKVEKVVKRRSFMDDYEERLDKLPVDDAEAIYEFGKWLEENDWGTRARLAFAEVLDLDPDHRGARKALGYRLYEGEWVSPEEENRRKGLVEFEGRWYTKHDLAEYKKEIGRSKELQLAIEKRRKVNAKVNTIARKFATFDKNKRKKAYDELYTYAEQLNSPELRKFAEDTLAYYDHVAKALCARMMARTEIHATHTQLRKPIQTFETTLGAAIALGAAQNPVKIQLPELRIAEVHTIVDIPAGCR